MAEIPKRHLSLSLISLFFFFFFWKTSSLSLSKPLLSPSQPDPEPKPPTVYEILPTYGLPSGLLPNSVTSYTLSKDNRFVVFLSEPCYVQFEEYLVYYDTTITGKLGYGSITELKGIEVEKFFFWLGVDEIKLDLPPSDFIYFQVGFINKKLDLDQFKTVHSCRDGVSASCGDSWKRSMELTRVDEIEMLITE